MKNRRFFVISVCLIVSFVLLSLFSNYNYPSKKAIKNGDIVVTHSGKYHLNNFFEFLEKKRNEIRIVVYTDEGDPIIKDLTRGQNDEIFYKIDNSRDKFSARDIKKGVCSNIRQEPFSNENMNGVFYKLDGCEGSRSNHIPLIFLENSEK